MASTNCGNVRFSEIEHEKGCFSANDQGGEQACQAAYLHLCTIYLYPCDNVWGSTPDMITLMKRSNADSL